MWVVNASFCAVVMFIVRFNGCEQGCVGPAGLPGSAQASAAGAAPGRHSKQPPVQCSSLGVALVPCFDPFSRDHAPPHIKLCLPFDVARNLAQLRIGSAHLEVEQGRKRRVSVPRADRLCRLCSGEDASLTHRRAVLARTGTSRNVEDLKHFMLECPVYDDLRAACPAFPFMYSETLGDPCVRSVFQHDAQSALAHTLYKMKVRRARLLGLTLGI